MSPMELLSAVNDFYDQAFNKLLAITFGIIAFIGVLVPVVVGWVQLRSLKQEKGAILGELRKEIDDERAQIKESIESSVREEMRGVQENLESRIEELSNDLKKSSALAEARSFHLQGLNSVRAKRPQDAVEDFASAATNYINGKSEANAQRCMNLIVESCLPAANKDQYVEMKMEKHCNSLLKKLEEENQNGRYANYIQKIESQMGKASNREPDNEGS